MGRTRTIVGALGHSPRPRHPLFASADSIVLTEGPLALAASGGPPGGAAGVVCLLDGFLSGREELAEALGTPSSAADEDLVGAAYLRWGEEMLSRLRGELTVVAWRPDAGEGLIARSRSGGRPVFVCDQGSTLYFATEVGDLLHSLPRRPAPDDVGVSRALGGFSLHDGRTLFEGVQRLGSGRLIGLDRGTRSRSRYCRGYWRPSPPRTNRIGREEAVAEVRRLVSAAVSRRVGAEDEAGILLSGGLDSSSVAGIGEPALALRGKRLTGYSGLFPDAQPADETPQLDHLATGLNVPQVRMALTGGSPLGAGIEYLRRWEVPLSPTNHFVWRPFLSRAAEEGVTVMLDGNGGDEVFSESSYLVADRLRRLDPVGAVKLARLIGGPGSGPRTVASILRTWGVEGLRRVPGGKRGTACDGPLFREETARLFRISEEEEPWWTWEGPRWWAHRAHAILQAPESFGAPEYQHRRAAEAGLTAQHPLNDGELVEFVLGLPPELGFDPVYTRPLLREAAAGLVPDEVRLKRGKAVFGSVFSTPFAANDLPAIRDLLGSAGAEVNRFVNPEVVERDLLAGPEAHPGGETAWAFQAWRLANVECWLKMQSDPPSIRDLLDKVHRSERETRTFFNPSKPLRSA